MTSVDDHPSLSWLSRVGGSLYYAAAAEFSVESACAQRLSADWQLVYGHPVVLDEIFVDPTCFADTSYRASV